MQGAGPEQSQVILSIIVEVGGDGAREDAAMTCQYPAEVVELMGPAACGALDAEGRAQLAVHLADCRDCREELRALRRVVRQLSALRQTGRVT